MAIEFEVSDILPAAPNQVYKAWLDSDGHTSMTGGAAKASTDLGGDFEAWDGYIHGRNLTLDPGRRIVQSWRTAEFDATEEDSQIEVVLEEVDGGTKVILRHTNLPPHGSQYQQGWIDHYFTPMKEYFSGQP